MKLNDIVMASTQDTKIRVVGTKWICFIRMKDQRNSIRKQKNI